MSNYSPDIRTREVYDRPSLDDILDLRERILDFAEVWPERATMLADKIVSKASADYDEEERTIENRDVRVRHSVRVVHEDYNDTADHDRYIVTVGTQVLRPPSELDELDGQLFVVTGQLPAPQKSRYIISFCRGAVSARVSSMDLRSDRTTVRAMTRYDVAEAMRALDDYMVLGDEPPEYADPD